MLRSTGKGFEQMAEVLKSAKLSDCGKYRFSLSRTWDEKLPKVAFVGLNPSTADAEKDDPTIRKCVGFARRLGFGGIVMLNLYTYRATKPADLWKAQKAGVAVIGEGAPAVRSRAAQCEMVIGCWGKHGIKRQQDFMEYFGRPIFCLGKNSDGTPCHPLMLSYTTKLEILLQARKP